MRVTRSAEHLSYSQCYILIPFPQYLESLYQDSITNPLGRVNSGLTLSDHQSRHISLGFLAPIDGDSLLHLTDVLRRFEEDYIGQTISLQGYGQFSDDSSWIGGTYLPVHELDLVTEMKDKVNHVFDGYITDTVASHSPPHCTTGRLPQKAAHQYRFEQRKADVEAVHKEAELMFSIDQLEIRGRKRFNTTKTHKYPERVDYTLTPFYPRLVPVRGVLQPA